MLKKKEKRKKEKPQPTYCKRTPILIDALSDSIKKQIKTNQKKTQPSQNGKGMHGRGRLCLLLLRQLMKMLIHQTCKKT
jgi:hypothetical protein